MQALVVVAHPDDEALFFSGLVMSKKAYWHIVCVTDGNADGKGESRQTQFQRSCKALGAKHSTCLNLTDQFEVRLDQNRLINALQPFHQYKKVFTHSVLGEYGHP